MRTKETLSEWTTRTGNIVKDVNGAKCVDRDSRIPGYFDLWNLSDHFVSSVMAGSVWLCPVDRQETHELH
jgi:hypothetical protein